MPSMTQASYSLPAGVLRRSIFGARSRNLGSMRPVYMSGGSTMWESAEISLYSVITDLLRSYLHLRSVDPISASEQRIPPPDRAQRPAISATQPHAAGGAPRCFLLDRTPLFIATCGDATIARLWPRHPGQSVARLGPLPVAFLPTLPAAAVHRLAAGFRCLLCQARSGHGGDVGDRGGYADPDGVSRRPVWRPAVPDRRHLADDPVDGGDGLCQRLLADR